MRAPVAAQGGDWREAVAKKPHPIRRQSRKYLSSQSFLRINETVLSHRGQNLVDDGAGLGVNSRSARCRRDCRYSPAENLLSANHDVCAPQNSNLPYATAVCGACACRSNVRDYTFERRDEPPPSASERYKTLCTTGPNTRRGTPHDITCANRRRTWWRVPWRFLHCSGDNNIEGLQGLIVKELLLRLSGAQKRDSEPWGAAHRSMLLGKSDADLRRPRCG